MKELQTTWISCYLFYQESLDQILIELWHPLVQRLKEQDLIQAYFFIRYWEGGPHIRFRAKVEDSKKIEEVQRQIIEIATTYFKTLKNSEYSLNFNKYIPEEERYAGKEMLALAERHFEISSNMVFSLLKEEKDTWEYSSIISYAIQLHMVFIKEIVGGSIQEAIAIFELVFNNWLSHSVKQIENQIENSEVEKTLHFFKDSYQHQQEVIDRLCEDLWKGTYENPLLRSWRDASVDVYNNIQKTYNIKEKPIISWMNFKKNPNLDKSMKELYLWYDSIIHMTNNRLGMHLRDEAFCAFLMMNGLRSLFNKKEQVV